MGTKAVEKASLGSTTELEAKIGTKAKKKTELRSPLGMTTIVSKEADKKRMAKEKETQVRKKQYLDEKEDRENDIIEVSKKAMRTKIEKESGTVTRMEMETT